MCVVLLDEKKKRRKRRKKRAGHASDPKNRPGLATRVKIIKRGKSETR